LHRFSDYSISPWLFDVGVMLSHTNSAVNFFLYSWRLKAFRKQLHRMTFQKISKSWHGTWCFLLVGWCCRLLPKEEKSLGNAAKVSWWCNIIAKYAASKAKIIANGKSEYP